MPAKLLLAILFFSAFSPTADSQSKETPDKVDGSDTSNSTTVSGFAFPIPAELYSKWKKYGLWDYKQQGSKYRDFTLFNFGATGNAAGISQNALIELSNSSKPQEADVAALDVGTDLQDRFAANRAEFEQLRTMADADSHLVRVAPEFTFLDSSSKWPREDVGINEVRWNEYRGLFKKLEISEGLVRNDDFPKAVFFVVKSKGLCTGGTSAGYVHSATKLGPTVKNVAEALKSEAQNDRKKHQAVVFKPLTENWYTFYEVDR